MWCYKRLRQAANDYWYKDLIFEEGKMKQIHFLSFKRNLNRFLYVPQPDIQLVTRRLR